MTSEVPHIQPGFGTRVSPLMAELLRQDSRPLTEAMKAKGDYMPAIRPISLDRYFDRTFAERERDLVWKKVWQYACREEDIPNVGDRMAYTVGALSYVIVRAGPMEIRAFHNSCLHRLTRLCDGFGSGKSIRCPFHAWEWNLDGSIHNIPSRWDFPRVTDADYRLPEARVGIWAGNIFINPSPDGPTLEQALGVMPAHFKGWGPDNHYTVAHARKLVRANWKVVMEAFLESYHVIETHSQTLELFGDANTQYDCWDDGVSHVNRLLTATGVPSPHLGEDASVAKAVNMTFGALASVYPGHGMPQYDPTSKLTGRAQIADWLRKARSEDLNWDLSQWPDSLFLDGYEYWMFPNFGPWYGEGLSLIYQFLPYGENPEEALFDVRLVAPVPNDGQPRPATAPIAYLGFDDPFEGNTNFSFVTSIFDQDMSNIPRVQAGLKAAFHAGRSMTLGRYQEQRIQHFHEVLDRTLGLI